LDEQRPLPRHIQFRLQQVARHRDIIMDKVRVWLGRTKTYLKSACGYLLGRNFDNHPGLLLLLLLGVNVPVKMLFFMIAYAWDNSDSNSAQTSSFSGAERAWMGLVSCPNLRGVSVQPLISTRQVIIGDRFCKAGVDLQNRPTSCPRMILFPSCG